MIFTLNSSGNRQTHSLVFNIFFGLELLHYLPTAQAISTLNAFTDANCIFRPRAAQPGHTNSPDGECQSITTPNTISVSIEDLDPGCAITVYSDLYCTDNALEINIGDCANLNGTLIRSFSVDGCPPGTPDYTELLSSATFTSSGPAVPSPTTGSTPSSTTPSGSEGPNRMAIIGGAVGGGIGLFMIVVSLIGWFLYKRNRGRREHKERMQTWPITPGGPGGYTGNDGAGSTIYGPGGYTGAPLPHQVGELEANVGNAYFKEHQDAIIGQKTTDRGGSRSASGNGMFENQVADALPLRGAQRQELEAPVPPVAERQHSRTLNLGQDGLPDMPRVPRAGE
ncbi:hypothetical protein TWF730_010116 [Orbilia blumenaviensis]|uniref:Uncharacterized protein n=1 Tax=Orbilia blumenaviensis TaxID=1796055 RepID=A0AAV9UW90_9PEZI